MHRCTADVGILMCESEGKAQGRCTSSCRSKAQGRCQTWHGHGHVTWGASLALALMLALMWRPMRGTTECPCMCGNV